MAALEGIKHVVVLMLENRSFDCMLGNLYPNRTDFEGLGLHPDQYLNPHTQPDGTVIGKPAWNESQLGPASACIPDPDPGELFNDINMQLFGLNGTPNSVTRPPMNGFIDNYVHQPGQRDPMSVMHYFTPKQVPVISQLAKAFGVSDQWYASAPCQTWPNRFFVHCGTCGGYVNNDDFNDNFAIPFNYPNIFDRLQKKGCSWRIYYHDVPQTLTLGHNWNPPFHFHPFGTFLENAANGSLPNYSFIEPRYFTDELSFIPNDLHPPHNIVYGEQLIAAVYNAVRS